MKKLVIITLILAIVTVGLFAQGAADAKSDAAPKLRRFSIGTAGTAGSLYPMGVAMAETITNHV
ncbi:MAG: hypothetical protein WCY53_02895, partial [Sphaerochaetaceae bacterium]